MLNLSVSTRFYCGINFELLTQTNCIGETMYDKKKDENINYILLMGIIMAFIGWATENISMIISTGKIKSRYYLLPFIPSYSLIVFIWYLIKKKNEKLIYYKEKTLGKRIISNVIFFLVLCLIVFVIEFAYGNLLDILFDIHLWSYENIPTHITKYASIVTSLAFGLGAFILVKSFFPRLLIFLKKKLKKRTVYVLNIVLWSLIGLDVLIYNVNLLIYHKVIVYWEIPLNLH